MDAIKKIIKYFNKSVKKSFMTFVLLLLFSIISKLLILIPPFLNGMIIDFLIMKNPKKIFPFLFFALIIYSSTLIISLIETNLNIDLSNKIIIELKQQLCDKIISLKREDFVEQSTGEYIERLDGDISTICSFYTNILPNFIISIIAAIGAGFFSFYLSLELSFIGIINFPISLLVNKYFGNKVKSEYLKVRNITDEITSFSQQIISGEKTIKGLHIENNIIDFFGRKLKEYSKINKKSGMVSAFAGLIQMIISTFFELLIVALACFYIINEKLTIGSYVSFNVYFSQFLSSLRTIAETNLNIQSVIISIERIESIMSYQSENIMEKQDSYIVGDIEICNLKFTYKNNFKVIDGLDAVFHPKTVTSIVGTSGCGKTTILNLLMHFYEFNGSIKINGLDINKLPISLLRNSQSYIQQDPFFLTDTIKNNLKIANPKVSDKEIEDVCKAVDIYDKIISLPNKFKSILKENACMLSEGEKQRLAIARGILKKTSIFLFDEVTSNLDGKTEKKISDLILKLGEKYTVIVVAHRLTLIERMPRILVLDKGKIVGEGNHSFLINSCKTYQKLFEQKEIGESKF